MALRIASSIFLLALTTSAFANVSPPGKVYAGAFGGGGSSNHFNGSQFGVVLITEAQGGPFAVNAFGELNNRTTSFFGAQLGYQAQEIFLHPLSQWTLGPAAELEGYTMNRRSFDGTLTNNTPRLTERDFTVSYPMKKAVFLANAVLNFNNPHFLIHPYIGFGIGNAIVKISGAEALQVNPPEEGNHYNANINDTSSTFAEQIKLGLRYDINKYVSFFAEYRWLYLASTHFVFGSTVFPAHAETSSWQVKLYAQKYNLGSVGVRFTC